jgi:ParB family chromosome partitioning protein
MSEFVNNTIFWVDVEKIKPNPYQPRKEFDERHLQDLADSIRMYGILQPLTVTRKEIDLEGGGMTVEYELIAGERRLRASKLAGIAQVPVLIQQGFIDPKLKLELAIIENLQREDLNPVDRALSFARLANEFSLKHIEIAKKVGKSREYVSNSLRLLALPQDILSALQAGKISEGHARPLLMLNDRPAEQSTLFKEIMWKKLTVREAEQVARHVAKEKTRKKVYIDPKLSRMEQELTETLGTRVHIEQKEKGGRLVIDFFAAEDVQALLDRINAQNLLADARALKEGIMSMGKKQMESVSSATPIIFIDAIKLPEIIPSEKIEVIPKQDEYIPYGTYHVDNEQSEDISSISTPSYIEENNEYSSNDSIVHDAIAEIVPSESFVDSEITEPIDDRSKGEQRETLDSEDDLYSVTNFGI